MIINLILNEKGHGPVRFNDWHPVTYFRPNLLRKGFSAFFCSELSQGLGPCHLPADIAPPAAASITWAHVPHRAKSGGLPLLQTVSLRPTEDLNTLHWALKHKVFQVFLRFSSVWQMLSYYSWQLLAPRHPDSDRQWYWSLRTRRGLTRELIISPIRNWASAWKGRLERLISHPVPLYPVYSVYQALGSVLKIWRSSRKTIDPPLRTVSICRGSCISDNSRFPSLSENRASLWNLS